MANIAICYDDRTQNGTYSGGSWVSGLALTNLKTYDPKQLARSTNDSAASTIIICDNGYPAPIEMLALINHKITDGASARVRAGPNSDGSSALIDETLDPADFGTDSPAAGRILFHLNSTRINARYIRWDITDESNADGYVQIGRHLAGPVFQPEVNLLYGAQLTLIDDSRVSRAVSGAQYADLKPKRRKLGGAFDMLSDDEAFGEVYNLQKLCGRSIPMLTIYDPDLTGNTLQRTSLYAVLTELQEIEIAHAVADGALSSWQFEIEERN